MQKIKAIHILLLIILLQVILYLLLRFTAWPEMLLWPYLILNGWLPYRDIAIAHNPLLFTDLTIWYLIFGVSVFSLKLYTWTLLVITSIFVWISFDSGKTKASIIAVIFYVFFTVIYQGNGLWFEHMMGLLALGTYLLTKRNGFLLAGITTALLLLTKQTAVWFLPAIALSMYTQSKNPKHYKEYIYGAASTGLVFALILLLSGILSDYLHWAVEFGIGVLPRIEGQIKLPALRQLLVSLIPYLVLPLTYRHLSKDKKDLVIWSVVGIFGVYPRWELFHFLPSLPFLAIIYGFYLSNPTKHLSVKISKLLLAAVVILLFARSATRNVGSEVRFVESNVKIVSEYIHEQTRTNDSIYVLNDWDTIYPLSDRLPATKPWVPHLSWYMEQPGIQEEIVSDLRSEKPTLIIMRPFEENGLSSYIPEKVIEEITNNYQKQGTIEGHQIWVRK